MHFTKKSGILHLNTCHHITNSHTGKKNISHILGRLVKD